MFYKVSEKLYGSFSAFIAYLTLITLAPFLMIFIQRFNMVYFMSLFFVLAAFYYFLNFEKIGFRNPHQVIMFIIIFLLGCLTANVFFLLIPILFFYVLLRKPFSLKLFVFILIFALIAIIFLIVDSQIISSIPSWSLTLSFSEFIKPASELFFLFNRFAILMHYLPISLIFIGLGSLIFRKHLWKLSYTKLIIIFLLLSILEVVEGLGFFNAYYVAGIALVLFIYMSFKDRHIAKWFCSYIIMILILPQWQNARFSFIIPGAIFIILVSYMISKSSIYISKLNQKKILITIIFIIVFLILNFLTSVNDLQQVHYLVKDHSSTDVWSVRMSEFRNTSLHETNLVDLEMCKQEEKWVYLKLRCNDTNEVS